MEMVGYGCMEINRPSFLPAMAWLRRQATAGKGGQGRARAIGTPISTKVLHGERQVASTIAVSKPRALLALLVGTASWTDKTLIESKKFYPPGVTTAEGRLRYYASQFQLVEVDSSY